MHRYTDETEALSRIIVEHARRRISEPQPLDGPATEAELDERAGVTITPEGLGGPEAFRIWTQALAPATVSTDHPANLAFVPAAPTEASVLFDITVGASSIIASTWIDGAGAIWAENQALAWLAGLAGMPQTAGGVFVPGATFGTLSALATARHAAAAARGGDRPARWRVAAADSAHSSITAAARVMDVGVLRVPHDDLGRLTADGLRDALEHDAEGVFAVVATAGTTNAGTVDDLAGIAQVCADHGIWLHVDGAYGGAGLAAPSVRARFAGIERADSLVVDPHKWLFAPYDCCALLYREPSLARAAHTQEASYLDAVNEDDAWNAASYSLGLSRRARGLPFWFSLATYGTDAYREAVEEVLQLTRETAAEIDAHPDLELLMQPELSVVLFRHRRWNDEDYDTWWRRILDEQIAFVQPTSWEGEKIMRLCFVNPATTMEHVRAILASMH
jgi:glutamate/tyrosine decarboxylase-like PLP-dependent enzyme